MKDKPFERSRDDNPSMGITLAPLVDIVFLLLIFFMVSTTFQVQPGLQVNLPESSATTDVEDTPHVITIQSDGSLYLNDSTIRSSELAGALAETDRGVVLKADQSVPHGAVVSVLDQIKNADVEVVNISTQPLEESR